MNSPSEIFKLLPKVAAEVGAIGKTEKNEAQKYRYRGIESVMNAVHPALVKYGVSVIPCVTDIKREALQTRNGGQLTVTVLTVSYTFAAPDGSTVTAVVIGEGMDSGDKGCNKAMTAAFKYAVGQVLAIPFDAADSEQENPLPRRSQQTPPPAGPASTNGQRPELTPVEVADLCALCDVKGKSVSELCARQNVDSPYKLTRKTFEAAMKRLRELPDARFR